MRQRSGDTWPNVSWISLNMISLNLHPTSRQLRQFSLAALVLLPVLGWLFSGRPMAATWTAFHTALTGTLMAIGAILTLLAFWLPAAVRPVYIAVALITFPIGLVISELILVLVWLILFVP